jgi:hypothetical protein
LTGRESIAPRNVLQKVSSDMVEGGRGGAVESL